MNAAPAALAPTAYPTAADVGELRLIALEHIHASPLNPRKHFDPAKLKELAASITAKGIIEPIIARAHPTKGAGHVEIAAGERRWRGAKLAKHDRAPVIVRTLTDAQMVEIMTIENLQRDNLQPIEEADGYALLMEKSGYDVPMIADKVGKSASYIYQRLKLRDLVPAVRAALESGKITPGHAIYIARLQPKDQPDALRACFQQWNADQIVSTRQLGQWIQRELHLEIKGAPFDTKDAKLLPIAGACTTCPKRSGANPDLFGDIERDSCTDRACWGGKVQAHLDAKRTELKAKGPLVEISTDYRTPAKGILARGQYTEAKKGDPKAVTALISEGAEVGKVTTVRVGKPTAAKRPKHHRDNAQAGVAYREKQEQSDERQRRLWKALLPKLPRVITLDLARAWVLRESEMGEVHNICRALGLTIKGGAGYPAATKALMSHVASMSLGDLSRVIQVVMLIDKPSKEIEATAKKLGVNLAAIDRELAAESKAKAATAKKAPAKKAKKK